MSDSLNHPGSIRDSDSNITPNWWKYKGHFMNVFEDESLFTKRLEQNASTNING